VPYWEKIDTLEAAHLAPDQISGLIRNITP
jgi:hypothetical protein